MTANPSKNTPAEEQPPQPVLAQSRALILDRGADRMDDRVARQARRPARDPPDLRRRDHRRASDHWCARRRAGRRHSDRPCVDCPTTKAVVTADARRRLRHAKTAAPPSWPYRIEDSSVLNLSASGPSGVLFPACCASHALYFGVSQPTRAARVRSLGTANASSRAGSIDQPCSRGCRKGHLPELWPPGSMATPSP